MKEKVETYNYADVISAAVILFKGGLLEEINSSEYYAGLRLFRICRAPNFLKIYLCDRVESEIEVCSIPIECISGELPQKIQGDMNEDAVPLPYSNSL